nr:MAG TPA: hypothetical protein [Caudoviricetes sp.]
MRKSWKEVRCFEIIEPYPHNFAIDRPWIFNLWLFLVKSSSRILMQWNYFNIISFVYQ